MTTSQKPLLTVRNLRVTVDKKPIVRGLGLKVDTNEVHAIMGPNGSGKSTFVNALMGHPKYTVSSGSVQMLGKNVLQLEPHERARLGLFLAFQYPKEIAGVPLEQFLREAYEAQQSARNPKHKRSSPIAFRKLLEERMRSLSIDPSFAKRPLNQGFSGGEKKKAEILQMQILSPKLALLDETDSGLDVDALKIVAAGVNAMRKDFSCVVVTHYARLLEYIVPDYVHVMVRGTIVESGGPELAHTLEREGYAKYGVHEESTRIALD